MRTSVEQSRRIEWEIYPTGNVSRQTELKDIDAISATDDIVLHMLSNFKFRMQSYIDMNGVKAIGYGYGNPDSKTGITEEEAFGEWIGVIKQKQSNLIHQLPLTRITQSQFDALLSLYVLTGSWKFVDSQQGRYDIFNAISVNDWETVANMIANGTENTATSSRFFESRVLQLGDYSNIKTRAWVRNEGIQYTRKTSSAGGFTDMQLRQAEISYYRELGMFLPTTTDLRKRTIDRIINQ